MTKEIELAAEDAAKRDNKQIWDFVRKLNSFYEDFRKSKTMGEASNIYGDIYDLLEQWMATRDRWVSVETAKPTDNHRYLIIDDDGDVSIDFYNLDENRFFCEEADDMFVTHFQELPSPPQSKNTK